MRPILKTIPEALGLPLSEIIVEPSFRYRVGRELVVFQKVCFSSGLERVLVTASATEWEWNAAKKTLTRIGYAPVRRGKVGNPQRKGKMLKDSFQIPVSVARYLSRISHVYKRPKSDTVAAAIISLYNALGRPGE